MTGTLAVQTTAIRVMVAPLALRHTTQTTTEVPPIPPHPPTTKTDPLTMGCPKGFHEHTALDIGNPLLSRTHPLTPALPASAHTLPTLLLTPFNEE